jgi:hypothetical protein
MPYDACWHTQLRPHDVWWHGLMAYASIFRPDVCRLAESIKTLQGTQLWCLRIRCFSRCLVWSKGSREYLQQHKTQFEFHVTFVQTKLLETRGEGGGRGKGYCQLQSELGHSRAGRQQEIYRQ